ncbi:MAG: xanthine dehydrogenase accessory protein XdhC, partial [Boseongicola sp. SB0673_bin_14]|nr:xanthine dehydrogenase accessory protein XdhC [Boseongicola sp. SB0673_bin_14]
NADRFPDVVPDSVTKILAAHPATAVRHAPRDAEHLILTYSHALDLEVCHQLLGHGFRATGLIGSATKWARFRSRLRSLGHPDARISRIKCPIGDPALGKHPQAVAVGFAAEWLSDSSAAEAEVEAKA